MPLPAAGAWRTGVAAPGAEVPPSHCHSFSSRAGMFIHQDPSWALPQLPWHSSWPCGEALSALQQAALEEPALSPRVCPHGCLCSWLLGRAETCSEFPCRMGAESEPAGVGWVAGWSPSLSVLAEGRPGPGGDDVLQGLSWAPPCEFTELFWQGQGPPHHHLAPAGSSFFPTRLPSIRLARPRFVMTAECESPVALHRRFTVTYTLINNLQDFLAVRLVWTPESSAAGEWPGRLCWGLPVGWGQSLSAGRGALAVGGAGVWGP